MISVFKNFTITSVASGGAAFGMERTDGAELFIPKDLANGLSVGMEISAKVIPNRHPGAEWYAIWLAKREQNLLKGNEHD